MSRISGAHMIYGGLQYPTLIFLGSPRIESRMPIATLTSVYQDLISRPSSASSNSDSEFDSRAVDSSIVSMMAFGIDWCIESTTDSGIDFRAVDSSIGSIVAIGIDWCIESTTDSAIDSRAVDSGIDSKAIDSRIDSRVHCKLRCGP